MNDGGGRGKAQKDQEVVAVEDKEEKKYVIRC